MGARNVNSCFTMWSHLPDGPFRLLVGMALQALDNASEGGRPPRVWFGGEKGLTELTGRPRSTTYRYLNSLKESGAIEALDAGRHGHRAVYRLTLDAMAKGPASETHQADADEAKGPTGETQKGPNSETEGSQNWDVKGPSRGTPRNHEGGTRKSREGRTSPEVTTSPARADSRANGAGFRGVEGKVYSLTDINDYLKAVAG